MDSAVGAFKIHIDGQTVVIDLQKFEGAQIIVV